MQADLSPEEGVIHHVARGVAESIATVVGLDVVTDPVGARLCIQALQLIHEEVGKGDAAPNIGGCRLVRFVDH